MVTYDERSVLVKHSGGLSNNAKGSSTSSTKGKEEVFVLAAVGSYKGPIRLDYLHLNDVINTKAIGRRHDTVAASSNPTSRDTDGSTRAANSLDSQQGQME